MRGLVLLRERSELRCRIEANVDAMFAAGVCDEVALARGSGTWARRAIGFREVEALIEGRMDMAACRDAMIHATWRYAKRQMTWCRTQFAFPALELRGDGVAESALDEAARLLEVGQGFRIENP